jgi:tRNA1(Val) A37 N6-methylase TrmN6
MNPPPNEYEKANNSYYTSEKAADMLITTLLKYCSPKIVLDPCAGTGSLVFAAQRQDIVVESSELDKSLCDKYGWECEDFLLKELKRFDAVICNPPFSEKREKDKNRRTGKDFATLFLEHSLKFANIVGFILHQGKGSLASYYKFRKSIPGIFMIHREPIPKKDSYFYIMVN